MRMDVEKFRDPLQIQLEKDVFSKLAELTKSNTVEVAPLSQKHRGLPYENKTVTPEEALAELAKLGITP